MIHRLFWSCVASLAVCCVLAADCFAQFRIPAGQEEVIFGALAPYRLDDTFVSGWTLEEISIAESTIAVTFISGEEEATFSLTPPTAADGVLMGGFKVVSAFSRGVSRVDQRTLNDQLAQTLGRNTTDAWWSQYRFIPTPTGAPPPPVSTFTPAPDIGAGASADEGVIGEALEGTPPDNSDRPGPGEEGGGSGSGPASASLPRIVYLAPIVIVLVIVIFVLPRFAEDDEDDPSPDA